MSIALRKIESLEAYVSGFPIEEEKEETLSSSNNPILSKWAAKAARNNKPMKAGDVLGGRMKEYEEQAYKIKYLSPNQPMIVRLDGHCFHTFTKGFHRPFDLKLHTAMVFSNFFFLSFFLSLGGYFDNINHNNRYQNYHFFSEN